MKSKSKSKAAVKRVKAKSPRKSKAAVKRVKAKSPRKLKAAVATKDLKIAPNFMLSEFTLSRTAQASGLSNTPPADVTERIKWVAMNIAQPIRTSIKVSLSITSGYRSPKVNALVGGVADSYHTYSEGRWAFDCHAPSLNLKALMEVIISLNLPLGKVILELDEGVIHLQGEVSQYLARDIVQKKKVYVTFESYKKTGKVA